MTKKKILFIGGSLNQTTMMYQISKYFSDHDCYFSAYYGDGYIDYLTQKGILDFCVLGGKFKEQTESFLRENDLQIDYQGKKHNYDLVFTGSDLIIPKNIRRSKVVLIQEGMTDPENIFFYLVKYLNFPRWTASTSTMGMSNQYDLFCVASQGYKELFTRKGANPNKIVVTGIPNFDNAKQYLKNDFPHKNYVLVATSDARETFKYENRKKFIRKCVEIANGKQLIFKLHPNEKVDRATQEINECAPGALVYHKANTNHMIANCDVLITKYSSVVYIGMALGKEVHSAFDIEDLKKLTPLQNSGTSAERIAKIALSLLQPYKVKPEDTHEEYELKEALNL